MARAEYNFVAYDTSLGQSYVYAKLNQGAKNGWRVISHADDGLEWSFVMVRKVSYWTRLVKFVRNVIQREKDADLSKSTRKNMSAPDAGSLFTTPNISMSTEHRLDRPLAEKAVEVDNQLGPRSCGLNPHGLDCPAGRYQRLTGRFSERTRLGRALMLLGCLHAAFILSGHIRQA